MTVKFGFIPQLQSFSTAAQEIPETLKQLPHLRVCCQSVCYTMKVGGLNPQPTDHVPDVAFNSPCFELILLLYKQVKHALHMSY